MTPVRHTIDLVDYSNVGSDGAITIAANATPVLVAIVRTSELVAGQYATLHISLLGVTDNGDHAFTADEAGGWSVIHYANNDLRGNMAFDGAHGGVLSSPAGWADGGDFGWSGFFTIGASLNGGGDIEVTISVLSSWVAGYGTAQSITFKNFRVAVEVIGGV